LTTLPFAFEGSRRVKFAQQGLSGIEKNVDNLIVVPNDRLLACLNMRTRLTNAFGSTNGLEYGRQSDRLAIYGLMIQIDSHGPPIGDGRFATAGIRSNQSRSG
jgi:hypothetical protein